MDENSQVLHWVNDWSPRRSALGHVLLSVFLNDLEKIYSEATKGCMRCGIILKYLNSQI